jgi:iron complex transport system substrate-binding protein
MKKENRMKLTLLNILFAVTACCVHTAAGVTETIKITDLANRSVAVPADPDRIICIGPGTLRLAVYLQAENKVVGVEDMEKRNPDGRPYWIAHPELARLPRCGPGGPISINKKPDLEAILARAPQVIFATYMDAPLADEMQRTLGIPVVVLSYGDLGTFDETVYDSLQLAGKVLNREQRADEVITYIEALRDDLMSRTKPVPAASKPSVYIGGIGYRGAQGIESTQKNYAPFRWVCALNMADQTDNAAGDHLVIDRENLLKKNPDVLFIDGGGAALAAAEYRRKPQFYQALNAFSRNQVYTVHPFNWYASNIGTALADAYAIGKILYKEPFQSVIPAEKADEIYTFLVGAPVYEHMCKTYGPIGQKFRFENTAE